MSITLSLAALTTVGLGARGRPWHGLVAGTLGLYLADASWSLMADGTAGFMATVTSGSWWIPASVLGAGTIVTGVPAVRRQLFGKSAWRRARADAPSASEPGPGLASADWQTAFLDRALTDSSAAWSAAAVTMIDETELIRRARTRGQLSSMEHRVSGVLGQAIGSLDRTLMGLPASPSHASEPREAMASSAWAELLALGPDEASDQTPQLSVTDRAELVLRAASHSMDAARALGWRWFSGLETLIGQLGTEQQRRDLLPPWASANKTLAAGWSGLESSPTVAVVAREAHGGKEVLGLRVTCEITEVVGADAATAVALLVAASDPDGLLEAESVAGEMTCVPVSLRNGLSVLDGVSSASTSTVSAHEVFVPMDQIIGGVQGIGAVDARLQQHIASVEAVRTTALLAGQGQRRAALRGSAAILKNVMSAETIEAWSHADLGATTLSLTALAKAAALVLDERTMTLSEARAFRSASQRLALDLVNGPEQPLETDAGLNEEQPEPKPAYLADSPSGWKASWQVLGLEAVQNNSPKDFDLAHSRGLREAASAGIRSRLQSMLERVPGAASRRSECVGTAFARVARAHALLRTLAARNKSKTEVPPALETHLRHAEERWTVCVSLALLDRLGGRQPNERPVFEFAVLSELSGILTDLSAAAGQLPGGLQRSTVRAALRAASSVKQGPPPHLAETVAANLAATPEMLHRLTAESFAGSAENGGTAPILEASRLAASSRVPIASIQRAQAVGQLPDNEFSSVLDLAVTRRIASPVDIARIRSCMAVASEFLSEREDHSTAHAERLSA